MNASFSQHFSTQFLFLFVWIWSLWVPPLSLTSPASAAGSGGKFRARLHNYVWKIILNARLCFRSAAVTEDSALPLHTRGDEYKMTRANIDSIPARERLNVTNFKYDMFYINSFEFLTVKVWQTETFWRDFGLWEEITRILFTVLWHFIEETIRWSIEINQWSLLNNFNFWWLLP